MLRLLVFGGFLNIILWGFTPLDSNVLRVITCNILSKCILIQLSVNLKLAIRKHIFFKTKIIIYIYIRRFYIFICLKSLVHGFNVFKNLVNFMKSDNFVN